MFYTEIPLLDEDFDEIAYGDEGELGEGAYEMLD